MSRTAEDVAEQADLEAAADYASGEAASQDEDIEDGSGEDISDFLNDDGEFEAPLEAPDSEVAQDTSEDDAPAEVAAEDDSSEAAAEDSEPTEASHQETDEAPSPSEDKVTREDLLQMLKDANAELAKYRAPEGTDAQATTSQQETGQGVPNLVEIRQAAEEALRGEYALTTEDADGLLTSPEDVMPRLMAGMHMRMMESVAQMVRNSLPNLIQNTLSQTQQSQTWEEKFFGEWQALKEHKDEVLQMKQALKGIYPNRDPEEIDREVGSYLSMRHGIVPEAAAAAKQKPRSAAKSKARPHVPLGRGPTNVGSNRKKGGENFFSELAELDMQGDI
jgi:hypothetical protein